MNVFSLLTQDSGNNIGNISTYIIFGVLIVAIIVMFVFSSRRNKKQREEAEKLINAVKPGNKVKTIGGVCGIVVEVDDEENTFVLETGSETSGKCFMKFDKQAIYQTDAVAEAEPVSEDKDEKSADEKAQPEAPVEQPAEPIAEVSAVEEEQPSQEENK